MKQAIKPLRITPDICGQTTRNYNGITFCSSIKTTTMIRILKCIFIHIYQVYIRSICYTLLYKYIGGFISVLRQSPTAVCCSSSAAGSPVVTFGPHARARRKGFHVVVVRARTDTHTLRANQPQAAATLEITNQRGRALRIFWRTPRPSSYLAPLRSDTLYLISFSPHFQGKKLTVCEKTENPRSNALHRLREKEGTKAAGPGEC